LLLPSAENVKTVQRIEPTVAFGASGLEDIWLGPARSWMTHSGH